MARSVQEKLPASTYIGSPVYKKSNALILSLSTPTLVTNKLFMISTMRAEKTADGMITASIAGTELRKIFGKDDNYGSFYETITYACYGSGGSSDDDEKQKKRHNGTLLDYQAVMEDRENHEFSAHNLVMDAEFKKGILSVTFNPKMSNYIIDMKNNYTCLNADEMMSMNSLYSYRFLEIFKQNMDIQEWIQRQTDPNELDRSDKPFYIQYGITTLKLMMGIIDGSSAPVVKAMRKKRGSNGLDYEEIEKFDTSSMKIFANFRRNVLEVAKKELDEKASIRFEYELVRSGRGGKTTAVDFYIYPNEKNIQKMRQRSQAAAETIPNMDDLIDEARDLIVENLPTKDLRELITAAGGDIRKVRTAYEYVKSKGDVSNLTGYMLSAIRENYQNISKKSSFGNIMRHEDSEYEEFMKRYT